MIDERATDQCPASRVSPKCLLVHLGRTTDRRRHDRLVSGERGYLACADADVGHVEVDASDLLRSVSSDSPAPVVSEASASMPMKTGWIAGAVDVRFGEIFRLSAPTGTVFSVSQLVSMLSLHKYQSRPRSPRSRLRPCHLLSHPGVRTECSRYPRDDSSAALSTGLAHREGSRPVSVEPSQGEPDTAMPCTTRVSLRGGERMSVDSISVVLGM